MSHNQTIGNEVFSVCFHGFDSRKEDEQYQCIYGITKDIVNMIIDFKLVGFYVAQRELQENINAFECNMDELKNFDWHHESERMGRLIAYSKKPSFC